MPSSWIGDAESVTPGATQGSVECLNLDRQQAPGQPNPYHLLFDNLPDPVWIVDPESFVILNANQTATERLGYSREEFVSAKITEFMDKPDDALLHFESQMREGSPGISLRRALRKKGGAVILVQVSSQPMSWLGRTAIVLSAHDITSHLPLEEQFQQSQKMEAIALFAGGIVHDFNNILTGILGFGELLQKKIDAGDSRKRIANEIVCAAIQGRNLTAQLVGLSRKEPKAVNASNIGLVLDKMEPFVSRLIKENSTLTISLDSNLGNVALQASSVFQILLNLILNAQDAMPAGGHISVSVHNTDVSILMNYINHLVPSGQYVELRVSDTGCGMNPSTMSKLFVPFFTTKSPARGTGLGLYTVHRIVKENGGFISVESSPEEGSTFGVLLPRVSEAVVPDREFHLSNSHRRKKFRILVVEDNQRILRMVCQVLEEHGFQVEGTETGTEALAKFGSCNSKFDLLLSDIVMPELNGLILAQRLTQTHPELKILFMTGHADERMLIFAARAAGAILEKPFQCSELIAKVEEVLGTQGDA